MLLVKKPFYFIRHGETDWNSKGLCMGQKDIPLNERGRQQAQKIFENDKRLHTTRIFYSPLKRAQETMEIVSTQLARYGLKTNCSKVAVDELREWHLGLWEGTLWDRYNIEEIDHIQPPEGETKEQFFARTIQALNKALLVEGPPLIVAHSGTFWALSHAMKRPITSVKHCTLLHCFYDESREQWQVNEYFNAK